MRFERLFSPIEIGGIRVKNRIAMAPMQTNLAGYTEGEINERIIKYYMERAKGGVGLITVGATAVDWLTSKSPVNQKNIAYDRHLPGWAALNDEMHSYGVKTFVQIHHAGRQCNPSYLDKNQNPNESDIKSISASDVTEKFMNVEPRPMETKEVEDMVERFGDAALRVKRAGFDGVMIHGAHGYLIEQFMSPYTNRREDKYGGTFENRMRFPKEIIKNIKRKCGDEYPIGFRISVEEFVEEGIHLEEGKKICQYLEKEGIDWLDITAGIYEVMPTIFYPFGKEEAWRVHHAEAIKEVVDIPVSCVGKIRRPETADKILREGKADLISLGRALLADPNWPRKSRDGKLDEIRYCIYCNYCLGRRMFEDKPVACAINPVLGREIRYSEDLGKVDKPLDVLVVGGGPAGMEAAWRSAKRGNKVTLYDDKLELGGKLLISQVPPGKDSIKEFTEWEKHQIAKNDVDVHLGYNIGVEEIKRMKPDVVALATGARPLIPDVPGIQKGICADDVLSGEVSISNKKVTIIGGGAVGCEVALYLIENGNKVDIIEMLEDYALDVEPLYRMHLREMLEGQKNLPLEETVEESVKIYTGTELKRVGEGSLIIETDKGEQSIGYEEVVLACGYKSDYDLADSLRGEGIKTVILGDAKEPGEIAEAVKDGYDFARNIENW